MSKPIPQPIFKALFFLVDDLLQIVWTQIRSITVFQTVSDSIAERNFESLFLNKKSADDKKHVK